MNFITSNIKKTHTTKKLKNVFITLYDAIFFPFLQALQPPLLPLPLSQVEAEAVPC